jgi:hypothetical protein
MEDPMNAGRDSRTVLSIPHREFPRLTTYDAKDPETSFPPIQSVRPPAGAPNILLIMLDDVGFGASSAFGGPCDGGGLGKGGNVTLYVDGATAGEGRVEATLAMVFSADDGCDVGRDTGAAVSEDYPAIDNAFNGEVKGVQLSIAPADAAAGHLVSPEKAIEFALARQ